MSELIVMMGIPGSGKSTWIRNNEPRAYVVCPDKIRKDITGDINDQSRNSDVFGIAHQRVHTWLKTAYMDRDHTPVIFDATNVTEQARQSLLDIAKEYGAPTRLVVFENIAQACVRNAKRDRVVPDNVMMRMILRFDESLKQIGNEGWDIVECVHN